MAGSDPACARCALWGIVAKPGPQPLLEDALDSTRGSSVSRRKRMRLDPRHRMLLEVCAEALENAGCDPAALPAERTRPLSRHVRAVDTIVRTFWGSPREWLLAFSVSSSTSVGLSSPSTRRVHRHSSRFTMPCKASEQGSGDLAIVGGAELLAVAPAREHLGVISVTGIDQGVRSEARMALGKVKAASSWFSSGSPMRVRTSICIYASVIGTAVNHDGRSSSLHSTKSTRPDERQVIRALRAANLGPGGCAVHRGYAAWRRQRCSET